MSTKVLMQTMLVQEHKDKSNIPHKGTRGFNVVRLTIPTFMDKEELFYYTIKNIINDRTILLHHREHYRGQNQIQILSSETSYISSLLVLIS